MNKTVFCCFLVGVLLSALAVECSAQSHFVRFSLDEAYIGEYPPRKIGIFFAPLVRQLLSVLVTAILGVTSCCTHAMAGHGATRISGEKSKTLVPATAG